MDSLEAMVILNNGIWHTTSVDRYSGILAKKAILPEPDIPDSQRWSTGAGPRLYPYVRKLGGVSLFDFADFNPAEYEKKCRSSNWNAFVPYQRDAGKAVWIEIDHEKCGLNLIRGIDLFERKNREGEHAPRIMPYIEAAHIGPIKTALFKRVIKIQKDIPHVMEMEF